MKRVLILGCNEIAKRLLLDLCEYREDVSGICLASRERKDCDELRELAASKGVRVTTSGIDVNNVEGAMMMVKIFAPDLIVNLLPPDLALGAMNLAIKAKADYIDGTLAGVPEIPSFTSLLSDQFTKFTEFQSIGKTAVCGAGFIPGAVSAIIRRALCCDFKKVDNIDLISVPSEKKGPKAKGRRKVEIDDTLYSEDVKPTTSGTSLSSFLDKIDSSKKVFYIKDGNVAEIDHFEVDRKSSCGNTVYLTSSPMLTDLLKEMPDVENARFFKPGKKPNVEHVPPQDELDLLEDLGLLSAIPVKVGDVEVAPVDLLAAILPKMEDNNNPEGEEVKNVGTASFEIYISGIGMDDKEIIKSYIIKGDNDLSYENYGVDAFEELKGTALIAGVRMMCTDKWSKPGVFTPAAFDCDEYYEVFTSSGIAVVEGKKRPAKQTPD